MVPGAELGPAAVGRHGGEGGEHDHSPSGAELPGCAAAVAAASGARTQLAGLLAAALVLVTLVVLTPLFRDLPLAALGAVIIVAAIRLIDVRGLQRLWRLRAADSVLALITFGGVLALGVLGGITVGVLASLGDVLRRAAFPATAVLGRLPGETPAYRDVAHHQHAAAPDGTLVYRFDAPLFFANADVLRDEVRALVATTPGVGRVILRVRGGLRPRHDRPAGADPAGRGAAGGRGEPALRARADEGARAHAPRGAGGRGRSRRLPSPGRARRRRRAGRPGRVIPIG